MIKKLTQIVVLICLLCNTTLLLNAEEDYSNTSYWNNLCTNTSSLSESEKASCAAYMEYMKTQNQTLQKQLDEIDSKKSEISENIDTYAAQISSYNYAIDSLNEMMHDLNLQITATEARLKEMQVNIDKNKKEIKEKEKEVQEIETKIEERMVESQKTMRINPFIDILMGAKTFDEFIRIMNGIKDINDSETALQHQLSEGIEELKEMNENLLQEQETLKQVEKDLEQGKVALDTQQASLLASQYEAELIRQTYVEQYNEVLVEEKVAQNVVDNNQQAIANVDEAIERTETPSPSSTETPTPQDTSSSDTPAPVTPTSDPTPSSGGSSENPYYGGWSNCTWGAWQLVHDTLGISLPGWGWSSNWVNDAAASGYATGSEPRVYSIAVYENHVAFVTAIDGDQVYIKEGNYLGAYGERWVSKYELPWTGQKCLGYIYF